MKFTVNQSLVAAVLIATATCYPQSKAENFNELCVNVVTGVRQHPDSCYQFIQCVKFEAQVQTCPEGQIFSTESVACVSGDWNSCQEQQPDPTCGQGYYGKLECPWDCQKYYNCDGGSAKLESCLDGYVYWKALQFCLPGYEEQGSCRLYSSGKK